MHTVTTLANEVESVIAITFIFGGGVTIALVSIISSAIVKAKKVAAREETRREIAAYVAEGSMSGEQAERLMAAGEKPSDGKKQC